MAMDPGGAAILGLHACSLGLPVLPTSLFAAGEIHELKQELGLQDKGKRKEAIKKVIAAMTVGKDVSPLFPGGLPPRKPLASMVTVGHLAEAGVRQGRSSCTWVPSDRGLVPSGPALALQT